MSNYKIITCCNRIPQEDYYCLPQYFLSLGDDVAAVLTEQFGGKWGGLGTKVRWLYKALKEGYVDTEYSIFTDCWDFVFAAPASEMIEKYKDFDCDLVISSEKNCFPNDLKEDYDKWAEDKTSSPYRYLNSGLIIGKTDALLKLVESLNPETIPDDYFDVEKGCNVHPNDQFEYQKAFLKQPVSIKLDYKQELCATLHETKPEDLDFTKERIRRIDTNTYPLSFHMNGNGKTSGCREYILNHLNLL